MDHEVAEMAKFGPYRTEAEGGEFTSPTGIDTDDESD
jgi:hypothetical protein